jgi:hypothetical protein
VRGVAGDELRDEHAADGGVGEAVTIVAGYKSAFSYMENG